MLAHRILGYAGSVGAGLIFAVILMGTSAGQETMLASLASGGAQGNGGSAFRPSISPDGRFVVFCSTSSNFASGDTNNVEDIFLRDRQSGATERVSVDSFETQANGLSTWSSVSSDGRFVAFVSLASNLVGGDTNSIADVFVRDRLSGTTDRVSVDSVGAQANSGSYEAALSADGRFVAFRSFASNLVSGDANGVADIFVKDLLTGTTELVSVASSGVQADAGSLEPSISADGRYIAFTSGARNLGGGASNISDDVFVRDRLVGSTECVSLDSFGADGNSTSWGSSISADGARVAFVSRATNLIGNDTNSSFDICVRDRMSFTTVCVSLDSLGALANFGNSESASISSDGRYASFQSRATNLVAGDSNGWEDIFLHDLQGGTTERVSVDSLGLQANGNSRFTALSGDGRHVVFASYATNLVSGDANGFWDIFVRDRCLDATATAFDGDGINADSIAAQSAILGSTWSAPLTIGHPHGAGGVLVLNVRTTTFNGPSLTSPVGGRLTEALVAGPLLARLIGSHDGVSGDIPLQLVPDQFFLAGMAWAAQYTVIGGGFADLSKAVSGVVGCP